MALSELARPSWAAAGHRRVALIGLVALVVVLGGGAAAWAAAASGNAGYRTATVTRSNPVAPVGAALRGHEFHYSTVAPAGDALELSSRFHANRGGYATATLLASYLHVHLGGDPRPAERFVATAGGCRPT